MDNLLYLTSSTFSLEGLNLANIALDIVVFLLLAVLLKKYAWDKLIDMLDERQKLVNTQLDEAERNQEQARKLLEENEIKLKNAHDDIRNMMDSAREQSKVEKKSILEEAKLQAERLKENARRDIEDEKKKALEEINKQIAELSVLVATKIIEKELDKEKQSELVDKIIKEVGDK